jgi:pimeloyl-ACP methyl ester carboxylesterase
MEKPITFLNKNGKKLFGIVHIPEQKFPQGKRIGINLLNPGIKYRVAPHRLNVKLARRLCNQGYYVLRFDPEGIGDSEGELPDNVLTADIWEKIQKGLFASDISAANDYFIEHYGIDNLILIGNCGGAISALLASERDERTAGLVLIDVPVNLRIASQSFAEKVVPGGVKSNWLFSEYIKRLFRFESWYRFFTLKTNYRALSKTLAMKVKSSLLPTKTNQTRETLYKQFNLNKLFYTAFEKFEKSDKPILFALAGNDKGTEVFEKFFLSIYSSIEEKKTIRIFKIKEANHIYTLKEWQESLISEIVWWLNQKAA